MSKKIVRCKKCKNRIPKNIIGFVKKDELHCSEFDILVDKDDGCTFGKEGEPIHKPVDRILVDISGHASVFG